MIVPMKKVSLFTIGAEKEQTLKKLRKLGLIHIEIAEGSGAKLAELKERISSLENAIFIVDEKVKKQKKIASKDVSAEEAFAIAEEILALSEEKKVCQAELLKNTAELDRLKAWGELSPDELAALAQKGVELSLYEMPSAEYKKLGDAVKTLALSSTKSAVQFLVVKTGLEGEAEALETIKFYRVELPQLSTAEIRQKISALQARLDGIEEHILSSSLYLKSMKAAMSVCEKEIEYETYSSGMAGEKLSSDGQKEVSVSYFTGYVEAEKLDRLTAAAKENAWGLVAEDPTEEDNVPTKLKNNKFVSLIYPLTDFLGTVPGYFEYDISSWFLTFILIFFGIIFGDGGYGLFICTIAAIPIVKALLKKQAVEPTYLLIGLFGLSTMLWGMLTCTWFGLTPDKLPVWLKSLSVPFISNVYADKLWCPAWTGGAAGLNTEQNLQIFCFSLALIQLVVAHLKVARRNCGSVKILGDIGAILQLVGMYYVVLSLVVNSAVFPLNLVIGAVPIGTVAIALVGIGFVMSFVFSNYAGSVIKSVLESMKNIVSVLLGVVNVFSDIVSYIRLWAVGLAGAAISATVNELAGPLLGNFMFMILAIVLLVFGHGLNMILNVLSVIVHGIRLNTLEFSTHLDMSWSGHKFKPFEE